MNEEYLFLNNNVLIFNCDLSFKNINNVITFYLKTTEKLNEIVIDFKNIINPNSCVLIFMVSCIRNARKRKQKIRFTNISDTLFELSKVYNIDTIIPN